MDLLDLPLQAHWVISFAWKHSGFCLVNLRSPQEARRNWQSSPNHRVFQCKIREIKRNACTNPNDVHGNRQEIYWNPKTSIIEVHSQRISHQGLRAGSIDSWSFCEAFVKLLAVVWTRDGDCQKKSKKNSKSIDIPKITIGRTHWKAENHVFGWYLKAAN